MGLDSRLARELAPFAAAPVLAFAFAPIGNRVAWLGYAIAAAVMVAVAYLAVRALLAERPQAAALAPSLLFLLALAVLRDSSGGAVAGVGALTLVPVFWTALHGTRVQLLVVIAAVWGFFVVPALLGSADEYPFSVWRTAALFAVGSAIMGLAVQSLVRRERGHAAALAVRERDLEAMAELARSLSATTDARERICDAARELSGADVAVLVEHQGEPELAADPRIHPEVEELVAAEPAATVVYEPVQRGDDVVGTLAVGWREPPTDERRVRGLVRLLASEAATALERADLLRQLTEIALTDALTGLPNRRALDERLDEAIAKDEPVCAAFLDLDHFKSYNDDHGHQAGDRLLKEAAAEWRSQLRPADMLTRYGGEEFVVLLHGGDLEVVEAVVERLRAATPRGQTCSAGIACREPGESAASLLDRADRAVYDAKRAGRDRALVA